MNTTRLFVTLAMAVVLSVTVLAQHAHETQPKDNQKQHNMSDMMGKPTFEQRTDSLSIRVWLITQTEHKQMMKDHGVIGGTKKDGHEMTGMMQGEKEENTDAKDHHMMDGGTNHDANEMSTETMEEMMEEMMAGTHHIMVMVTDGETEKILLSANVKISLTSPSKHSSIVGLKSMMNHFGGGLTLDEKGNYTLDILVSRNEKTRSVSFAYEVK